MLVLGYITIVNFTSLSINLIELATLKFVIPNYKDVMIEQHKIWKIS